MVQMAFRVEPAWSKTRRRATLGLPQVMRRDHIIRRSLQLSWMTFWVAENTPMKRTFSGKTNNNSRIFVLKMPGKILNWDKTIDHLQVQWKKYLRRTNIVNSVSALSLSLSHIKTLQNEERTRIGQILAQIGAALKVKEKWPILGKKILKRMLVVSIRWKMMPTSKALPRINKKCQSSTSQELSKEF